MLDGPFVSNSLPKEISNSKSLARFDREKFFSHNLRRKKYWKYVLSTICILFNTLYTLPY